MNALYRLNNGNKQKQAKNKGGKKREGGKGGKGKRENRMRETRRGRGEGNFEGGFFPLLRNLRVFFFFFRSVRF